MLRKDWPENEIHGLEAMVFQGGQDFICVAARPLFFDSRYQAGYMAIGLV